MSTTTDEVVTLRGERELAERAGHLFTRVREEYACAADDLNTWSRGKVRTSIEASLRRRPPGVSVYKLFTPRALADEESERYLLRIAEAGVQVRISPGPLPQESIMIDRRLAIVAGPPVAGVRTFAVVRNPDVVTGIRSLFQTTWDAATDLADFRRDRVPVFSEESREILRRLGAGLKDDAAARQLGMSLRTYRRRVAELMTLLGAQSRFQAGARARELGL